MERQREEEQVALKYKQLQQEAQIFLQRMLELEDEKRENELVLDTIKDLEPERKCWRLINGVLFEKAQKEVVPELTTQIKNIDNVIDQISSTLKQKKYEISQLEVKYESIMKQAKE